MSDLPPSSPQPTAAAGGSPEQRLNQAVAALKQRRYATAIQGFSSLSQDPTLTSALRLKAQIGWVKALQGDGQTAAAIARCQSLATHPQPKVKQWANQTLVALGPTPPTPANSVSNSDLSGFQPLAAAADATVNRSGFQPLAAESDVADNRSGFQPLKAEADTPAVSSSPPAKPPAPESRSPQASPPTLPTAESTAAQNHAPPHDETRTAAPTAASAPQLGALSPSAAVLSAGTASLFHYENLNQIPAPVAANTAPPSPTDVAGALVPSPAPTAPETATPPAPPLSFRQGGRLDKLRPLGQSGQADWQVWLAQLLTAIALVWLSSKVLPILLWPLGHLWAFFSRFLPLPSVRQPPDPLLIVTLSLIGLLLAAPWLLDVLLKRTQGLRTLSLRTLQKTHPEGCRLLRRLSQEQGWLLPLLRELPVDAPLIFSYGWLPRYSRIVVSRGLRNQLSDEELATLIGYELSHLTRWTLPLMSLVALLLQLLHQSYWQSAQLGDRTSSRLVKSSAAGLSALSYLLYWLVRKVATPAARARVLGSDRQAVIWTGNPNALVRALVKLETGIADSIVQTGYTPPWVESTDLLTPCGYETALGFGSLFPAPLSLEILQWDIQNPYRRWLALNSSHPLLGERLKRLTGYAQRWQLLPELPFPELDDPSHSTKRRRSFGSDLAAFLLQISPYIGPLVGVTVAMLLWFLGGVFEPLGLQRVAWIYGDRSVLWGSLLLGLGMGIMVRINAYFPDITSTNRFQQSALPALLKSPLALPTDSRPIRLEGTLLGRPGIANWLGQDLILATPTQLFKLHFSSLLGPPGNLLSHPQHPIDWLGRPIEIQGWYRRGAIAWIDVDLFLTARQVVMRAQHPLWSVVLSLCCCASGLLILFRG
ncbi:MAG: M48 family metallopeptidase [Leptolyngbyaceae cyanobacterium]